MTGFQKKQGTDMTVHVLPKTTTGDQHAAESEFLHRQFLSSQMTKLFQTGYHTLLLLFQ